MGMKAEMAPGGWGYKTTPAGTDVWRYIITPEGVVVVKVAGEVKEETKP